MNRHKELAAVCFQNPRIHDTAVRIGFGGVKRQVELAGYFLPPSQGSAPFYSVPIGLA